MKLQHTNRTIELMNQRHSIDMALLAELRGRAEKILNESEKIPTLKTISNMKKILLGEDLEFWEVAYCPHCEKIYPEDEVILESCSDCWNEAVREQAASEAMIEEEMREQAEIANRNRE